MIDRESSNGLNMRERFTRLWIEKERKKERKRERESMRVNELN